MNPPGATALASGGKDSTYAAYLAETQGWSVDELLVLEPADPDSMMFHTPNLELVPLQAEAWGKRCRRVPVPAGDEQAETDALMAALSTASPTVTAGAIASSYQWARAQRTCYQLGRRLYDPLWGKSAGRVVREEIATGLDIRLVQVAAEPLGADLLGRRLDLALLAELERRSERMRRVNVAGEGGEYETLVVDAPFFRQRIEIVDSRTDSDGGRHRLTVQRARLVPKQDAGRLART
ncbi:MAG: diphthine--ammonia ligase [Thermoplasmata archaeon]|nr:diphthine--ammonia ligase [Thermoplasmata archaeon]